MCVSAVENKERETVDSLACVIPKSEKNDFWFVNVA